MKLGGFAQSGKACRLVGSVVGAFRQERSECGPVLCSAIGFGEANPYAIGLRVSSDLRLEAFARFGHSVCRDESVGETKRNGGALSVRGELTQAVEVACCIVERPRLDREPSKRIEGRSALFDGNDATEVLDCARQILHLRLGDL